MRDCYLGDSFDIVKRFWAESLRQIAPLYSHPQFVPPAIRTRYTAMTTIPVLDANELPVRPFGLLLDPHTGIPLNIDLPCNASASHARLRTIIAVKNEMRPAYMICFDQSYHRRHKLARWEQLDRKCEHLQAEGIFSFYYSSHAPFLFMADEAESLAAIKMRLVSKGVPEDRFGLHPADYRQQQPA